MANDLAAMAAGVTFIPTQIANYVAEEVVVGDVLRDFTCKALLYGQCLMTVGGYVVRGITLSCGRRARAIRRQDGAFERVNPSSCSLALTDAARPLSLQDAARPLPLQDAARPLLPDEAQPPQPQQQQTVAHPTDDLASAASSICLAIQGSPGPEGSLLPKLEAQAEVEASELPFQERRELFEGNAQQPPSQQQQK